MGIWYENMLSENMLWGYVLECICYEYMLWEKINMLWDYRYVMVLCYEICMWYMFWGYVLIIFWYVLSICFEKYSLEVCFILPICFGDMFWRFVDMFWAYVLKYIKWYVLKICFEDMFWGLCFGDMFWFFLDMFWAYVLKNIRWRCVLFYPYVLEICFDDL